MNEHIKGMNILYGAYGNLYVNLTNKCPCSCVFCLRNKITSIGDSGSLWLEHDPSYDEVISEFKKFSPENYKEVVFCGFGDPTEALDVLLSAAAYVKNEWKKPVRVNTNGLGSLVNRRDVPRLFKGLVDTVSISLNTSDPDRYQSIMRPRFGKMSYGAMLEFAKECVKYVPNVILTTVETTITHEDEEKCRRICETIGAKYRIRPYIED